MNLIQYAVLAIDLINLVVGVKFDLNEELKFSNDLSSCTNIPRCCPSGMSESGKCIINAQQIDSNFTCTFMRQALGIYTDQKLSISRHGHLLFTEEDTITKQNATTAFTTFCCNEMNKKVIAFVCVEDIDALFSIHINPFFKVISGLCLFLFCLIYLAPSWRKTYPIMVYILMTGIEYIMIVVNIWWINGQSKLNPEFWFDKVIVYVILSSRCCLLLIIAMEFILYLNINIWIADVFKYPNLTFNLCITTYITIAFIIPFIIVCAAVLKELVLETVINIVVIIVMCIIFVFFVVMCIKWIKIQIMPSRQEIQKDAQILEYFGIFIIIAANFCFSEMVPLISTLYCLLGPVVFILLKNKQHFFPQLDNNV